MEETKQKTEGYKVIATKVDNVSFFTFLKICRKLGIKPYEFLQMMVSVAIRYCDDRHNLTQEMELAMSLFEHMIGWKDALNIADPTVNKEISDAIYFLIDPEGKKKGTYPVMVQKPFFGHWSETSNIQQIVERFLCLSLPERYRRLRLLAVDMGCSSILQLLDRLIDHHAEESDIEHIRREFEDADRSDYGNKPWEQPFKRKPHKDPDSTNLFNTKIEKNGRNICN